MSKSKEQESEQAFNHRIEVFMVDRTAEKTIKDFLIGLRIFAAVKDGVAPYCWEGWPHALAR